MSVVSAPGQAVAPPALPAELRVADPDRRFYAFAIDRLIAWGIDVAVAVVASQTAADDEAAREYHAELRRDY